MSQHKYTIKKEDKNPGQSTIVKSNVEVEFTLDSLAENERDYRKMIKQLTAQKQLADAKMRNIEDHHPFVMDLSEEQAFTVHMYQEARAMSRVCGQKLPEYVEELEYVEAEKKEIEKQIGIAIPIASLGGDEVAVNPTHQHEPDCKKLSGGECNCNAKPIKPDEKKDN